MQIDMVVMFITGNLKQSPTALWRSRRARFAAVLSPIVLAFVGGLAAWSPGHIASLFSGAKHAAALVSYSVSAIEESPCESGGAFVPEPAGREVVRDGQPVHWADLYEYPGSAFVRSSGVEVSIQGESNRAVTLTGIKFKKKNLGVRPKGIAFQGQCGGGAIGRFITADLDSNPPRVVTAEIVSRRAFRPIRFPWTVSVTDPLLLDVGANTQRCFCEWWAEISWVSGSEKGVVKIGEPNEGFRVTNEHGLPTYIPHYERWQAANFG